MHEMLQQVRANKDAWPFLVPVNRADVPDYYDVIKARCWAISPHALSVTLHPAACKALKQLMQAHVHNTSRPCNVQMSEGRS